MDHDDGAVRVKEIRAQPIERGRAQVRLFQQASGSDRSHPRLRLAFVDVDDPQPPALPDSEDWTDAAEFRSWLAAALNDPALRAGLGNPPAESPHYWQNAIHASRITALLDYARAELDRVQGWTNAERRRARYAIAELGALAYAGDIQFDDENTGTYHSYRHDQPFVHVLELLLASLPEDGTEAFDLLPSEQQYSVRRQRKQLRNHDDWLMRHSYAYEGITETDIERTLGGFLIDRETRQIASEDPATRDTLQPRHQLLRIDPNSDNPHAGAWIMRTKAGFALRDGTPVEVDEDDIRTTTVAEDQLTFERAPNNPKLRAGVRFDWNSDGWIDAQPIPWITWAGYCDVKAVLEALGLALLDQRSVWEYRSDTGKVSEFTRDLQLELLTAAVELGSNYQRLDGTGVISKGIHRFGGARNDSLPDRLQFRGAGRSKSVRWPLSRERKALEITRIVEDGDELDVDAAFYRYTADLDAIDFSDNPRYLETVDGDYNVIDARGMVISATLEVQSFDAAGQVTRTEVETTIDLRKNAHDRSFLGTQIVDPAERELYRVYFDPKQPAIVAELWRWDPDTGDEVHVGSRDEVIALADPVSVTVSREQKLDDPGAFEALVGLAIQHGQNICADTDDEQPVWNGVVTRIEIERLAVNRSARVEHWRSHFTARYGVATLEYLVRRTSEGEPETYCPIPNELVDSPDFLWQDLPDIASKAKESGAWVVNENMYDRELVDVRWEPQAQGGWYVLDDHIKNSFELLYVALADYRYTIVHQNKRYVYENEAAWKAARKRLDGLRAQLTFE